MGHDSTNPLMHLQLCSKSNNRSCQQPRKVIASQGQNHKQPLEAPHGERCNKSLLTKKEEMVLIFVLYSNCDYID
jgi:hypothetical protein